VGLTWDLPQTEEGLCTILRQLDEEREAGNDRDVAYGLLAVAHMVLWVRSDTDQNPFVRAHELSSEALALFRRVGDARGQIRALVSCATRVDPATREEMLAEAEELASGLGDVAEEARVISARARSIGMRDRKQASDLTHKALLIYRKLGSLQGQARSLFSIAIYDDSDQRTLEAALEAAEINRKLDDRAQAARCMTLALMNARDLQKPLEEQSEWALEGLKDALASGNRKLERSFYRDLTEISSSLGEMEDADKYRRWGDLLEEAEGRDPLEKWEDDVEMTRAMIDMAKAQGNAEAVKAFKAELKRLKASKPQTS
jgi:hypothetical protein